MATSQHPPGAKSHTEAAPKEMVAASVPNSRRLFRAWRGGALHRRPLDQSSVRLRQVGVRSQGRQSQFRAAGITNYFKNGGKLELARQMAAHASARTTSLYERCGHEISLAEIERIYYSAGNNG